MLWAIINVLLFQCGNRLVSEIYSQTSIDVPHAESYILKKILTQLCLATASHNFKRVKQENYSYLFNMINLRMSKYLQIFVPNNCHLNGQ